MNAGSSPDIGKSRGKGFVIPITEPPIVEIDTEATAAYIRLRDTKVARTEPYESEKGLVMLDFDAKGNVASVQRTGKELVMNVEPTHRSTPTLGRKRSFFEELFGNIGQIGAPGLPGQNGGPPQ